jgi:hypothetical protein
MSVNPGRFDADVMSQIVSNISMGLMTQKEEQIKAAIDFMIGKPWTIEEITGRGEFHLYPDKTEVFAFDGQELIRFYPIETVTEQKGHSTFLKGKQNYELLYS